MVKVDGEQMEYNAVLDLMECKLARRVWETLNPMYPKFDAFGEIPLEGNQVTAQEFVTAYSNAYRAKYGASMLCT